MNPAALFRRRAGARRPAELRVPAPKLRLSALRSPLSASSSPPTFRRLTRAGRIVLYWLSWAGFLAVGLALNVVCAPLLLLPQRERYGPAIRRVLRALFSGWCRWHAASGVIAVEFCGFDRPIPPGTVVIANHPTITDATFLLARLPDAFCIFKPALMRHPAIGPSALMAGYVSGVFGVDLIRDVAARIATGRTLLLFPEGTRTAAGRTLGPLNSGFALIAARARAPVQLVVIRAAPDLGRKGVPWWHPPSRLPAGIQFTLDQRWEHDPARSVRDFTAAVEQRLRTVLA
jgi:1-acyl-sn-glycerol-3-phosphate acyltransferase